MPEPQSEKAMVVVGVIVKDRNVLLVQRQTIESGENHALLHWVFPGGTIEAGETEEDALWREVLEETGCVVETATHIDTRRHPEFPVVISYFLCAAKNDEHYTFKTDEIRELRWVPIDDIKEYFTSSLNPAVESVLQTLKEHALPPHR